VGFTAIISSVAHLSEGQLQGDYASEASAEHLSCIGLAPEEEEITYHAYWEKRSSKITVCMADEVLRLLKTFDQELALKYNKFYISCQRRINPLFCHLWPEKDFMGS
jgi:hypothetical protein